MPLDGKVLAGISASLFYMVTARLVLLLKLRSFEPEVLISRDHLLTLKILKTNPGKVKQFLNKTAILYGQTAQEHIFKF